MKEKIIMTVYITKKDATWEEKIKVAKQIVCGEKMIVFTEPWGIIHKFDSAIGTKDRDNSARDVLACNTAFFDKENEILSFIVPEKPIYYNKKKHTSLEMMILFQNFLYKVFGDMIRIEFKLENADFKLHLKDFTLSHFYSCYIYGECTEEEFSATRLLKKKEVEFVEKRIKEIFGFRPIIHQGWCETCYGHHPESPYHIEVREKLR